MSTYLQYKLSIPHTTRELMELSLARYKWNNFHYSTIIWISPFSCDFHFQNGFTGGKKNHIFITFCRGKNVFLCTHFNICTKFVICNYLKKALLLLNIPNEMSLCCCCCCLGFFGLFFFLSYDSRNTFFPAFDLGLIGVSLWIFPKQCLYPLLLPQTLYFAYFMVASIFSLKSHSVFCGGTQSPWYNLAYHLNLCFSAIRSSCWPRPWRLGICWSPCIN